MPFRIKSLPVEWSYKLQSTLLSVTTITMWTRMSPPENKFNQMKEGGKENNILPTNIQQPFLITSRYWPNTLIVVICIVDTLWKNRHYTMDRLSYEVLNSALMSRSSLVWNIHFILFLDIQIKPLAKGSCTQDSTSRWKVKERLSQIPPR